MHCGFAAFYLGTAAPPETQWSQAAGCHMQTWTSASVARETAGCGVACRRVLLRPSHLEAVRLAQRHGRTSGVGVGGGAAAAHAAQRLGEQVAACEGHFDARPRI
eukprot:6197115-Pleurochrysis_carterae.AAC.1